MLNFVIHYKNMPFPFPFSDGPAAPDNTHDLGDLVTVEGEWSDPDTGEPLDPATVKLEFKDPAAVTTTWVYGTDPEIVRVSEGLYRARINADQAGKWGYRWYSEGDGQAAEKQYFTVEEGL